MFPASSLPHSGSPLSPILLPVSPFQPLDEKRDPGNTSSADPYSQKENAMPSNTLLSQVLTPYIEGRGLMLCSGPWLERPSFRTKKSTVPVGRPSLTPGQRKIQKLEEKIRRLESKLHRAERQDAVHSDRLVELASENQTMRQELQDALEEGQEAKARVRELEGERELFHTWWINEVKFSQSLMDNTLGYPYTPGTSAST